MEGRHPVRVVDLDELRSNPGSVAEQGHLKGLPAATIEAGSLASGAPVARVSLALTGAEC
jgi:hypothetical protein